MPCLICVQSSAQIFFCYCFLRAGHTFKQKWDSSFTEQNSFHELSPSSENKKELSITYRIQSDSIWLNSTLSLFPTYHPLLIQSDHKVLSPKKMPRLPSLQSLFFSCNFHWAFIYHIHPIFCTWYWGQRFFLKNQRLNIIDTWNWLGRIKQVLSWVQSLTERTKTSKEM